MWLYGLWLAWSSAQRQLSLYGGIFLDSPEWEENLQCEGSSLTHPCLQALGQRTDQTDLLLAHTRDGEASLSAAEAVTFLAAHSQLLAGMM